MNRRRLLKLAEFLETAELPGKFDMSFPWAKQDECGTVACALGWAATIPAFRRAGLYLAWPAFGALADIRVKGSHAVDLDAGMEFFDLTAADAGSLFCPADQKNLTGKRGRRIVAARIRKLVESAP